MKRLLARWRKWREKWREMSRLREDYLTACLAFDMSAGLPDRVRADLALVVEDSERKLRAAGGKP